MSAVPLLAPGLDIGGEEPGRDEAGEGVFWKRGGETERHEFVAEGQCEYEQWENCTWCF